jgi:hypothetical protein
MNVRMQKETNTLTMKAGPSLRDNLSGPPIESPRTRIFYKDIPQLCFYVFKLLAKAVDLRAERSIITDALGAMPSTDIVLRWPAHHCSSRPVCRVTFHCRACGQGGETGGCVLLLGAKEI